MNYKDCVLCSKKCHINREKNIGPCGANNIIKVARASLHFWEEPIISGDTGSGTVFFSNCNLNLSNCNIIVFVSYINYIIPRKSINFLLAQLFPCTMFPKLP